jgi:hypothetical protein
MSFGREVGAALTGAPGRADWQNCRLDQVRNVACAGWLSWALLYGRGVSYL